MENGIRNLLLGSSIYAFVEDARIVDNYLLR